MLIKRNRFILCLMLSVFQILCFLTPIRAQDKAHVSREELQGVVDLLEDPQKRGVFIQDLKRLLQTKELAEPQKKEKSEKQPEPKAKEAAFIADLFMRFEVLSGKIVEAASSAVKLVGRVPETFDRAKVFLADGANRAKILRLLINIAIAIFIAFMVRAYTRKRMKQLTRRMGGLPSRIAFGFLQVFIALGFLLSQE